jgi:hypothetical protein
MRTSEAVVFLAGPRRARFITTTCYYTLLLCCTALHCTEKNKCIKGTTNGHREKDEED